MSEKQNKTNAAKQDEIQEEVTTLVRDMLASAANTAELIKQFWQYWKCVPQHLRDTTLREVAIFVDIIDAAAAGIAPSKKTQASILTILIATAKMQETQNGEKHEMTTDDIPPPRANNKTGAQLKSAANLHRKEIAALRKRLEKQAADIALALESTTILHYAAGALESQAEIICILEDQQLGGDFGTRIIRDRTISRLCDLDANAATLRKRCATLAPEEGGKE